MVNFAGHQLLMKALHALLACNASQLFCHSCVTPMNLSFNGSFSYLGGTGTVVLDSGLSGPGSSPERSH